MNKEEKNNNINNSIDKDLIDTMNIMDELNDRVYSLEFKLDSVLKMSNLTTNTINYILASMVVYESYLQQFDFDLDSIKREIDEVYFNSFANTSTSNDSSLESNILKKINDKLKNFQDKINKNK